jgi:hypothetical protein
MTSPFGGGGKTTARESFFREIENSLKQNSDLLLNSELKLNDQSHLIIY